MPRARAATPDVVLTPAGDTDTAFVMSTWAESYRRAPANKGMPTSAFHAWHRPRMEAILSRKPLVLVARGEGPFIYGYIVAERVGDAFVAHWVYVRGTEKRQGIARLLLAAALQALGGGARRLLTTHRSYTGAKADEMGFALVKLRELYASAEELRCA